MDRQAFRRACSAEARLLLGPFALPGGGRGGVGDRERALGPVARAGVGVLAVAPPAGPTRAALGELEGAGAALDCARRACAGTGTLVAATLTPLDAPGPVPFGRAYIAYHERVKALAAGRPDLFWIHGGADLAALRAAAVAVRELWRGAVAARIPGPRDPDTPWPTWPAAAVVLAGLGLAVVGLSGEIDDEEAALLGAIAGLPSAAAAAAGMPLPEVCRFAETAVRRGAGLFDPGPGLPPEAVRALAAVTRRARAPFVEPRPALWLATSVSARAFADGLLSVERIETASAGGVPAIREALRAGGDGAIVLALGGGALRDRASVRQALEPGSARPLLLEAADPELLEAALRTYPGRPLVRVLAGDPALREECVYLCGRYGAALLAALGSAGGSGPGETAEAERWLAWAERHGLAGLWFECDVGEARGMPRVRTGSIRIVEGERRPAAASPLAARP